MSARVEINQTTVERMLNAPDGFVAKELLKRAIKVERGAKRFCPVDTGRLRSSISHDVERDERGLFAVVGTNVEYAIYVEEGTRYMRAQPFLRPALREAT